MLKMTKIGTEVRCRARTLLNSREQAIKIATCTIRSQLIDAVNGSNREKLANAEVAVKL